MLEYSFILQIHKKSDARKVKYNIITKNIKPFFFKFHCLTIDASPHKINGLLVIMISSGTTLKLSKPLNIVFVIFKDLLVEPKLLMQHVIYVFYLLIKFELP
tara:strand:+ start:248 stop:553 length:306 start_codon:yes stop_codon:yes gene_type:complete